MGAIGGGGVWVWVMGVVGRRGGVEVRAGGGRKGNMAGRLVGCWPVLRRGNAGACRVLVAPSPGPWIPMSLLWQMHSPFAINRIGVFVCLLHSMHKEEGRKKISQRILLRERDPSSVIVPADRLYFLFTFSNNSSHLPSHHSITFSQSRMVLPPDLALLPPGNINHKTRCCSLVT